MKQAKLLLLLCAFYCVLALNGCGYTFQGSGSVLPPDVKKISIPLVENYSTEPGLSSVVTEALQDRFERFGVVSVVEDANEADAILKARILDVKRQTRTTTSSTDTALQYDTVLTLEADLRRVSGPSLWSNPRMSVSKGFGSTGDVVVTSSVDFSGATLGASDLAALDNRELSRGQEQQAFENLAEEVAKRIYNEAVAPDF